MTNTEELIKKYFPQNEWDNARRVMQGESGGNPGAVGDNYPINGVHAPSYGLFQIRGLPGRPSKEQLLDPEFNVKYAANMQAQQGWGPWTAAKNLGITGGGTGGAGAVAGADTSGQREKMEATPENLDKFRNYILSKFPRMNSKQRGDLNTLIESKKDAYEAKEEKRIEEEGEKKQTEYYKETGEFVSAEEATIAGKAQEEAKKEGVEIKGKEAEPESATTAKLMGQLTSGLNSIKRVEDVLNKDKEEKPGFGSGGMALFGAKTGRLPIVGGDITPWGRGLQYDLENMADVILRGRTGAAANKDEIRRYLKSFGPAITDPPKVRQQKVESMKLEMETTAKAMGMDISKITEDTDKTPEDVINEVKYEKDDKTARDNLRTAVQNFATNENRNFIVDVIFGAPIDYVNDVARALELKGKSGEDLFKSWDTNMDIANDIMEGLDGIKDPEQRKAAEQAANRILDDIIEQSAGIEQSFSQSIKQHPLFRGLLVGADIAGAAGLITGVGKTLFKGGAKLFGKEAAEEVVEKGTKETLKFAGGERALGTAAKEGAEETAKTVAKKGGTDFAGKAVDIFEKVKRKIVPKAFLGTKRAEEAAKVGKLPKLGEKLFDDALEIAKTDRRVRKELLASIDDLVKVDNVPTLVREMKDWGSWAYKAGGEIKSAKLAKLYDSFYKTGLAVLKEEAPNVYKYQKLLGYANRYLPKKAGSILWKLVMGKVLLSEI